MHLKFVIDNLDDLKVLPVYQSPSLVDEYKSIAQDEELSQIAAHKCEKVFKKHLSNKVFDPEVARRIKELWFAIKGENYPLVGISASNLTIQQVDVDQYIKNRSQKLMQNLTVEEVEVTDYV